MPVTRLHRARPWPLGTRGYTEAGGVTQDPRGRGSPRFSPRFQGVAEFASPRRSTRLLAIICCGHSGGGPMAAGPAEKPWARACSRPELGGFRPSGNRSRSISGRIGSCLRDEAWRLSVSVDRPRHGLCRAAPPRRDAGRYRPVLLNSQNERAGPRPPEPIAAGADQPRALRPAEIGETARTICRIFLRTLGSSIM
jgi:hypothetical protein